MGRITLVTGGARSGKSSYAEHLALSYDCGAEKRVYIATAESFDDEMKQRIAKHQERRVGLFCTVEEPVKLGEAILKASKEAKVVMVDCLTVWTSNLLYYKKTNEVDELMKALETVSNDYTHCDVILVTNETGMGIVPDNALSRQFRDLAGFTNQKVAKIADNVVFMVCGLPMAVKGSVGGME